jgi:UDP-glucose 4-epimerase
LLGLDNLVEAVDAVLRAEAPLRRPLIVADGKPLTLGAMIAAMRYGLGRRPALFYVPEPLLKSALSVAGQATRFEPLFGSLVADPSALARLNWAPRVETGTGLATLLRAAASP